MSLHQHVLNQLHRWAEEDAAQHAVTLESLVRGPRRAAYYLGAMVLGTLAIVPSPGVPVGTLAGLCLLVLSWQIWRGRPVRVPSRWAHYEISAGVLSRLSKAMLRFLPEQSQAKDNRWGSSAHRWAIAMIAGMAVLVALPLPLGNTFPGLAIVLSAASALNQSLKLVVYAAAAGFAGLAWPLILAAGAVHWLGS